MQPENLRAARQRRRLTQKQVAEILGVAEQTVANWESGRTSPRTHATLLRDLYGDQLGEPEPSSTLREATDLELLAELTRRAIERAGRSESGE